jgi:hypothetical protein
VTTIFILDDTRTVQAAIEGSGGGVLSDNNLTFSLARNPSDAYEIVMASEPFNTWILDNDLGPGLEGMDFLKQFINGTDEQRAKMPRFLISCSSNPARRADIEAYFNNFVLNDRKPMNPAGAE